MSDTLPCRGCGAAIIALPEDPYTATLTGDPTFPYFLLCPPGANCYTDQHGNATQGGTLYFDCCGHLLSAAYNVGDNLALISSNLSTQCQNSFAQECGGGGAPAPLIPGSVPIYFSPALSADAYCPDGSVFSFSVPAGQFVDRSLSSATLAAQRYATAQATAHKVCLGSLSAVELPISVAASVTLTATGSTVATSGNTWILLSGALPTGLTLSGDGPVLTLTGTPSVAGSFTFTLKITTPTGEAMSKAFTICVIAISPGTLPDGTISVAYSQTLTATDCATAPLSWQITSGALPHGITLDEPTGVISGTPTESGNFTFTVLLQDAAT